MSKLPLYDQLLQSIQSKPEDEVQPKKICSCINNLNETHFETIYSLIIHHATITSALKDKEPPYEHKFFDNQNKKGLYYTFLSLPQPLQRIINEYIIIYGAS
jgi:hypothetical protein